MTSFGVADVHVDVGGVGAGVVDRLRERGLGVDGVDFGGRALGDWALLLGRDFRALNRKAELHWAARQALQAGHASVPEAYRETIWRQAGGRNYEVAEKGSFQVEKKERVRARFGESPDYADAWVLSFSRIASSARRIFVV